MQIQQYDPKIISITKIRRNIDVLEKVLHKNDEAVVMRNQNIMFIALTPKRYRQLKTTRLERTQAAADEIAKIRSRYKFSGNHVSDFIVKSRDERIKKWKK